MAIEILSKKDLTQVKETTGDITLTASVEAEAGAIKRISNGAVLKGEEQVGNFSFEENGMFYLNLGKATETISDVCAALPGFINQLIIPEA